MCFVYGHFYVLYLIFYTSNILHILVSTFTMSLRVFLEFLDDHQKNIIWKFYGFQCHKRYSRFTLSKTLGLNERFYNYMRPWYASKINICEVDEITSCLLTIYLYHKLRSLEPWPLTFLMHCTNILKISRKIPVWV